MKLINRTEIVITFILAIGILSLIGIIFAPIAIIGGLLLLICTSIIIIFTKVGELNE
jgi:hypothetical protein|tara:strand:+ start:169 stop:339 length:171 start_codon:yes stop_codon:yes gene_type:complete